MSMCRVVSCIVGKGCLLWPVPNLLMIINFKKKIVYLFGCVRVLVAACEIFRCSMRASLQLQPSSSRTSRLQVGPWGMWDLGFWMRDWTWVSCIGRQILNHWTTREVLTISLDSCIQLIISATSCKPPGKRTLNSKVWVMFLRDTFPATGSMPDTQLTINKYVNE